VTGRGPSPGSLVALTACTLLVGWPRTAVAEPWSLLRSENRNVRAGNEKLAAKDAAGALEAYDRAARELPSEGGVHLNRGLALLANKKPAEAREALKLAVQSKADPAARADAHYDLGLSFYGDADEAAGKDNHENAQQLFREAAESFKQSLRLRPGDRNTAWNYELALRRIHEQQEKQKEKEQKDKEKQKDEQSQDQKDQQNQDQQNQDQQNQDQKDQDQQQPQDQKDKQDQQKQDQQQQDQSKQDQQQQDQPQPEPEQAQPRSDAERALDALQDGEENLEKMKAQQRAARERRVPEKDW